MVASTNQSTTVKATSSKLYFNAGSGELSATSFNSLSDITVKENVHTIDNALDLVNNIRGVSFNWTDNKKKSYGVVAQEIEKVLPHAVTKNDNGQLTVAYNNIVGVLIQAVKELSDEIKQIKK